MVGRPSHRERLLTGALECIQELGYSSTTARDIARKADAHAGSISYHFGSKDDLMAAAICQGFREWSAAVSEALPRAGLSAEEALGAAAAFMVDSLAEHRPLVISFVEALSAASHQESIRQELADAYTATRASHRASLERTFTEMTDSQREALATIIVAVLDGLVIQWLVDNQSLPPSEDLAASIAAMVTGVSSEVARSGAARPAAGPSVGGVSYANRP